MTWSSENESPTLFSNEDNLNLDENNEIKENDSFSDTLISDDSNEDDLEIPAFLRKQKN